MDPREFVNTKKRRQKSRHFTPTASLDDPGWTWMKCPDNTPKLLSACPESWHIYQIFTMEHKETRSTLHPAPLRDSDLRGRRVQLNLTGDLSQRMW